MVYRSRKTTQDTRHGVDVTPMPQTASVNSYETNVFDGTSGQSCLTTDNDIDSSTAAISSPSAPHVGAVVADSALFQPSEMYMFGAAPATTNPATNENVYCSVLTTPVADVAGGHHIYDSQ